MRYKYRKTTPEDVIEMERLRAEGLTYKQIAEKFKLSTSVVQYHLIPKYRENCIVRSTARNKLHPFKSRNPEYIKNYIKDRYNNDEEFRIRFIGLVTKSFKKRKSVWFKEGLCSQCGKEKIDKKFKTCEVCRKNNRIKYKNDKEKEMEL